MPPRRPKQPTIGSFLFEYLHGRGARHAFGIPGDFALPTFWWLERSPIELITMTHEPAVGFAADGYARIRGLGLACVTYCVGGLNMLNSIAGAYAEKSPVVVVSGGPSATERQGDQLLHHKVKTFDTQRRIYEEVTCANTILLDPETAADEIIRVVDTVIAQRRPGYIEVPHNIVDAPIRPPRVKKPVPAVSDQESLAECLREATGFINQAKRPVILAGIELHRHKVTRLALDLAESFNIPMAADILSKSVIGETHPLYIGVYSGALSEPPCRDYVDQSDCVIMLGTFVTDMFLGVNTSRISRRLSILSTTERTRVGLHHYDGVAFADFLDGLRQAKIRRRPAFKNPNPAVDIKPLGASERNDPLESEDVFRLLAQHVDENTAVVCDAGDALFGAMSLRTAKRKEFIAGAYYLSMGFAVPTSIGVMAADPKKRVFTIVGDGAFQMTGMELSTAAKCKMAPIVLILNNDGYGTQRIILDGEFNEIHRWQYTRICDVLRAGRAMIVSTKGQLDDALTAAVGSEELSIIEVRLPRDSVSPALRRLGEELARLRGPHSEAEHPKPKRTPRSKKVRRRAQ
ncbi:MAG: alpha-keto acid decarboxylase family protein [Phycisphaerae bacterium]|nr:alpha-keto acid decarboxylase family protein [Phycisphaerae bacterium]